MAGKLAGKIAVVTGGARGIGGGIATAFAAEGADVVDRRRAGRGRAAPVLESIEKAWPPAPARAHRRVRRAAGPGDGRRRAGRVRPGRHPGQQRRHLDPEVLHRAVESRTGTGSMSVNLRGGLPVHQVRARPACSSEAPARIINIASQLGQIGGIEMVHYSASKAGVIGLTKALAREVSRPGGPGQRDRAGPDPDRHDGRGDRGMGGTASWRSCPIGRFGEVHEVAPTAVLLASDDSVRTTSARRSAPTAAT